MEAKYPHDLMPITGILLCQEFAFSPSAQNTLSGRSPEGVKHKAENWHAEICGLGIQMPFHSVAIECFTVASPIVSPRLLRRQALPNRQYSIINFQLPPFAAFLTAAKKRVDA